jgi:hypothetical protein
MVSLPSGSDVVVHAAVRDEVTVTAEQEPADLPAQPSP